MKYGMRSALLLLIMSALAACSTTQGPVKTYEGALRSNAELVLVSVPEEIEVMAIDGQEPPPSFLKSRVQLALLPGEHVFSLRYVELFQLTADDHDVIRSKQAALRFKAAAGSEYRLTTPPQKDVESARKFSKSPQFSLVNVHDGAATDSVSIKSMAEASLIDTISKAFTGSADEPVKAPTKLDLLKDVWGRATPEEQAGFRVWLNQQGK
ncbi:MAG: DUF2057 family protein [Moraxellaceae bacterium]